MPSRCPCGCGRRAVKGSGIYVKGHQPAGTSRDPLGKDHAHNAAYNRLYQLPIRKKLKKKRRADAEAYLIERIYRFHYNCISGTISGTGTCTCTIGNSSTTTD